MIMFPYQMRISFVSRGKYMIGSIIAIAIAVVCFGYAIYRAFKDFDNKKPPKELLDELDRLARKDNNPLTPEEANHLQEYIDKANKGLPFSYDEINDYYKLVEEAKKDQPKDINPWPLIALGAFLLGLWLGSKKQD